MNDLPRKLTPVSLRNDNLSGLPVMVSRPNYDRSALKPGIVHVGLGNFHRAHQAWYLHQLMQMGEAHDWAIIGAGVRPYDEQQRMKLAAQDHLTTLIELDPKGTSAEVIGPMIDYIPVQLGNAPLIDYLTRADIRIVALTVTEGGYYLNPTTQGFDAGHADMRYDAEHPDSPATVFGAMVAALSIRRELGIGPFTGLSCDNLQGNGNILRQTVVSLARLSNQDLAEWIDQNCSFPNSMVDCIVPATGPQELELVKSLGIEDSVPVTHENYRQWVIEDDFCAGRPAWEKVGATFSGDVHTYESMKIRILNASHTVIAETGQVMGVKTIAECMAHPKISEFIKKLAKQEIAPTVTRVPEYSPSNYVELVLDRFSNPKIVDTTFRVATDGSSKHPGFLLPIIRDQLAANRDIQGLALAEAIWSRMCEGTGEDGSQIAVNDPFCHELQDAARAARSNPAIWIGQQKYYGELENNPKFTVAFSNWLRLIWAEGVTASIEKYLNM